MTTTAASITPDPLDFYRTLEFFQGAPDTEIAWMVAHGTELHLNTGEHFAHEDQPTPGFYVMLEGELQITRTVNNYVQVMGTTPPGIIGGEMALLFGSVSNIGACALVPSRLLFFTPEQFRLIFGATPKLATRIMHIAAGRTQGYATNVIQQEKMAALGKLSAGLAHELNNPAAAVRRAVGSLRERLPQLQAQIIELNRLGLSGEQITELVAYQQQCNDASEPRRVLSPLEQSDREEELGLELEAHGIANAWELAPVFVAAGATAEQLHTLASKLPAQNLGAVLVWLATALDTTSLLDEIQSSTQRISDLVQAIKSYTYRDQGKVQDVDINRDLDTTLTVLRYKLKKGSVEVVRQYDPDLPIIQARGSELNQVWTNLIDNAIDAVNNNGRIQIITRREQGFVMVEVADDGAGIPADVRPRIFEPFFTTKGVGSGTGLGLDISYRIIQEHRGTIEVFSRPGQTRFIVRIPEQQAPPSPPA